MSDDFKGKAKEAWGSLTGDEAKKEEGRAQRLLSGSKGCS